MSWAKIFLWYIVLSILFDLTGNDLNLLGWVVLAVAVGVRRGLERPS